MTEMQEPQISVSETFEKETKIVVIFKGDIEVYKEDCPSLRRILGQAFPLYLTMKKNPEEPTTEKWLMKQNSWNDKIEKHKNLTHLEKELREAGIALSYLHADLDMIQFFPKEVMLWDNYLSSYLEDENPNVKALKDQFMKDGLIDRLDIRFDLDVATIEVGEEKIVGNHFRIKTKSLEGCEALKICHKQIVKAFLEVLNSIDGIATVRYYCGDIEHNAYSKIACVLDKVDNGK